MHQLTTIQKNKVLQLTSGALRSTAMLCSCGALLQTFLASLGYSSQFIYMNSSLSLIASVLITILGSQWGARGNVIKRASVIMLPYGVLFLCYIPFCIWKSSSTSAFALFTLVCVLQAALAALYTVCDYKLPYFIYPPQDYGAVCAIGGIIGSGISIGYGAVVSRLATFMSYPTLMLIISALSALMMLLASFLTSRVKSIVAEPPKSEQSQKENEVSVWNTLKHPIFLHLLPVNTIRGFSHGSTIIVAALALDLGYGTEVATALVAVQSAAGLIGSAGFGISTKFAPPRILILIGSLIMLVMPLMLCGNSIVLLLAVGVMCAGRTCVDYAVPWAMRFSVPVSIAGPYNAWRMLAHNCGNLVANAVASMVSPSVFIIIATATHLITGILFFTSKVLTKPAEEHTVSN